MGNYIPISVSDWDALPSPNFFNSHFSLEQSSTLPGTYDVPNNEGPFFDYTAYVKNKNYQFY